MSPFYPGPTGLIIQNEGTILSGATTLNFENGGAVQTGGTVSYAGNAIEVTNGTITVNSVSEMVIGSGLVLTASENAPTIVQKAFFSSSAGSPVNLPNIPANGNLVVMVAYGYNGTFAFPGAANTLFDVTEASNFCALATLTANGTTNYQCTQGGNACIAMYEIEGWSSVVEAAGGATTSTGSGPYTSSETLTTSAANNCLVLLFVQSQTGDGPTSISPASWVIDGAAIWYNGYISVTGLHLPAVEASTASISYENTNNYNGKPYGYIAIAGVASGNTVTIAT